MTTPIIHPTSHAQLTLMLRDLPGSVLLTGETGVGLATIAAYIADQIAAPLITVLPEKDEKVDIKKGSIGVDSIRRLYDQTRSKQTGHLVVLVDYAERMGSQAQNAFLKLLEEPREGIHFILATHTPDSLLPTIHSRAQQILIQPITRSQTEALLDSLGMTTATKRTQLLYMADGLPAELTRLVHDDDYFEARSQIVRDAREFLGGSSYTRLRIAHRYSDSRDMALQLLSDSLNILKRTIQQKPDVSHLKQIDALLDCYKQIKANGHIKLNLARFVVQ